MTVAEARGTRAHINLQAIAVNVATLRAAIGPGVSLMAVVKADAYGHGAVPVASVALEAGANWLGVASAEEGRELREAGLTAPILVLGASNADQAKIALAHGLDLTVFTESGYTAALQAGHQLSLCPQLHLKVDTGMGRVGVHPDAVLSEWVPRLATSEVRWSGLMSHLAESDAASDAFTRYQLGRFLDLIESLRRHGVDAPPHLHLANSAATLRFPGTHFTMVRAGLALYGAAPYEGSLPLAPALSWVSEVTMLKRIATGQSVGYGRTFVAPEDLTVATVAVGYADGYRRVLSDRAEVVVKGRRCRVVGRISMDQTTIAIPNDLGVQVGDVVELIGPSLRVEEVAQWAETISYEILTGIGSRVPREYRSSPKVVENRRESDSEYA